MFLLRSFVVVVVVVVGSHRARTAQTADLSQVKECDISSCSVYFQWTGTRSTDELRKSRQSEIYCEDLLSWEEAMAATPYGYNLTNNRQHQNPAAHE